MVGFRSTLNVPGRIASRILLKFWLIPVNIHAVELGLGGGGEGENERIYKVCVCVFPSKLEVSKLWPPGARCGIFFLLAFLSGSWGTISLTTPTGHALTFLKSVNLAFF